MAKVEKEEDFTEQEKECLKAFEESQHNPYGGDDFQEFGPGEWIYVGDRPFTNEEVGEEVETLPPQWGAEPKEGYVIIDGVPIPDPDPPQWKTVDPDSGKIVYTGGKKS